MFGGSHQMEVKKHTVRVGIERMKDKKDGSERKYGRDGRNQVIGEERYDEARGGQRCHSMSIIFRVE